MSQELMTWEELKQKVEAYWPENTEVHLAQLRLDNLDKRMDKFAKALARILGLSDLVSDATSLAKFETLCFVLFQKYEIPSRIHYFFLFCTEQGLEVPEHLWELRRHWKGATDEIIQRMVRVSA